MKFLLKLFRTSKSGFRVLGTILKMRPRRLFQAAPRRPKRASRDPSSYPREAVGACRLGRVGEARGGDDVVLVERGPGGEVPGVARGEDRARVCAVELRGLLPGHPEGVRVRFLSIFGRAGP